MRRRTRVVVGLGLAVAVGAAVGLFAYRTAALEALLTVSLAARGVPAPRLTVTDLGWRSARIADVRLGSADEISVRSLRMDYSLTRLLGGHLDLVAVEGLSLRLDATGAGPPLGSIQPLVAGDGGGAAAPIPPLDITDLNVEARTPGGVVRVHGEGGRQVHGGDARLDLALDSIALDDRQLGTVRVSLRLGAADAEATATLRGRDGGFAADLAVTVANLAAVPRLRLDLTATASAASVPWAVFALPPAPAGRADLVVHAEGRLPLLAELFVAADPLRQLWRGMYQGRVQLTVADAAVADHFAGLGASVRADLGLDAGAITVTLIEEARVAATQVSADWLDRLGLPAAVGESLGKGFLARIPVAEPRRPLVTATADRDGATIGFDGTLDIAVPEAADLGVTAAVDIRLARDRVHARLRGPGSVRVATLRSGDVAELLAPLEATVSEAEVTVGAPILDYRLSVEMPSLRARVHAPDAPPVEIAASTVRLQATGGADGGHAEIAVARIAAPTQQVAADAVTVTADLAGAEVRAAIGMAAVRQTTDEPLLAPVALSATIAGRGDTWQATATATGPDGVGRLAGAGTYDAGSGTGTAHMALDPLVFTPDGAQPGALVPALAELQRAAGTATAEADLSWSAKGLRGAGTVALSDLSFDSPQARVEGLDLRLRLDRLAPPGSPPGQTLTIRRIDPGVPLERLAVRFHLPPAEPPRLVVETGEVFVGGGRFSVQEVVLDPAAARQTTAIRVEDLSLAQLFALLGIDGLSGEGRLSGTIPVVFAGGNVLIEDGRLAAAAPGIVRFRSEQAAQILADQGESLDLVLRALEDFHYDELTVGLEKTADDVGRMRLSLLGKNPAVLEGYPFRFNISIEANPGRLIEALSTIYRVPSDFLRRAWTSGG